MTLPPEKILNGALRVLSIAAVYTRSCTLADEVSRKRINDLWEAIHEIPDLLTRWCDDSEAELVMYLQEYGQKWKEPNLEAAYADGLARAR
jgi:hypothetical protein